MNSDSKFHALAIGLATLNSKEEIIEVYYPQPLLNPEPTLIEQLKKDLQSDSSLAGNSYVDLSPKQLQAYANACEKQGNADQCAWAEKLAASQQGSILCFLETDQAPSSIAEAFLKLQLLSHRLVKPHEINLDGAFAVLKNLAWTNEGAVDLQDLPERQLQARLNGGVLDVQSVDKFPKLSNYVAPSGVRIADTSRVRLGAYLGEGTTVMHEGFVNFNAGTEGPAMIEGRISAGVMVGANSDLGGGCSTMGTLSGGGKEVITVGKNCLIGANAGIGFPLADGCIVEAGLYVTAGTKLNLLDHENNFVKAVKAKDISHLKGHLFRRNSLSGGVECLPLKTAIELNDELHSNN